MNLARPGATCSLASPAHLVVGRMPVAGEQAMEAFLFDSPPWRAVASALHVTLT